MVCSMNINININYILCVRWWWRQTVHWILLLLLPLAINNILTHDFSLILRVFCWHGCWHGSWRCWHFWIRCRRNRAVNTGVVLRLKIDYYYALVVNRKKQISGGAIRSSTVSSNSGCGCRRNRAVDTGVALRLKTDYSYALVVNRKKQISSGAIRSSTVSSNSGCAWKWHHRYRYQQQKFFGLKATDWWRVGVSNAVCVRPVAGPPDGVHIRRSVI